MSCCRRAPGTVGSGAGCDRSTDRHGERGDDKNRLTNITVPLSHVRPDRPANAFPSAVTYAFSNIPNPYARVNTRAELPATPATS